MASAITGTVAALESFFHRRLRLWIAAILFSLCFFADAAFLVWQDAQTPLPQTPLLQTPIAPPAESPAMTLQPAVVPQAITDEAFTKRRAQTLASDIMRFYVSRDVMQPRGLAIDAPRHPRVGRRRRSSCGLQT